MNTMEKSLEEFESLFLNTPHVAVMFLDNDCEFLKPTIENIVQRNDGKLHYQNFQNQGGCARFKSSTRDYEFVILGNVLQHCEFKEKFLSLVYRSLENSAQIILVMDKTAMDLYEAKDLLDKCNFLAANNIEIFEDKFVIVAKKMHMWDGGL